MSMSAVGIVAGKQVVKLVAKKFGSLIVEKWTRYRAESFYAGFIESLSLEREGVVDEKAVDEKLDSILGDEKKSEVLFDAYRSVCFSRSKELGPRIIGFLTGTIVLENRVCSFSEEQVFRAAEQLSDSELYDFFKTYRGYVAGTEPSGPRPRYPNGIPRFNADVLVLPWCEKKRDSNQRHSSNINTAPLNLNEAFGSWGGTLGLIGIVTTSVVSEQKHTRFRTASDDLHTTVEETFVFTVFFNGSAKMLAALIERALTKSTPVAH